MSNSIETLGASAEELATFLYSTSSTLPGPFQELNESFLLGSAYLVFFMHCGFAMVSLLSGCSLCCPASTHFAVPVVSILWVPAALYWMRESQVCQAYCHPHSGGCLC